MCGKLKTIKVEVRNGTGTIYYTYQTRRWPNVPDSDNQPSVQPALNDFSSQDKYTLAKIFRGNLSLCAMQKYENRAIWKLIFDHIEEESELQD